MSRWILALALVLAACGGGGGGGGGDDGEIGIGDEAVDGQFTFVVSSFDCGETEVTEGNVTHTARGQFCILNLSITNTGTRSERFIASSQGLINADGVRFDPQNEATTLLSPDSSNRSLNPGDSICPARG